MGLLEDALRDAFAQQVAGQPGTEGMADRAIRRARAIRRRRVGTASAAAVFCLVLVGVGVLAVRDPLARFLDGPRSEALQPQLPTGTVAPLVGVKLPADVLNGDRIQVADGRVVSLAGLGTVARALRVDPGWLVQTNEAAPRHSRVWLVDEKGLASPLAEGDATMVSPGTLARPDPQVAWVSSGRLSVSTLVGSRLAGTTSTLGVDALVPVRAVGAGVLLSGAGAWGDGMWDMWFPDKGAYRYTVPDVSLTVLGVSAGASQLLARYADQPACLTEVEPETFKKARSVCDIGFAREDRIYVSPGGHWWLVTTATTIDVYDAASVWSRPAPVYTLDGRISASAGWLDDNTFVVLGRSDVTQVSMKDRLVQAVVQVPESGASGAREIVADLR